MLFRFILLFFVLVIVDHIRFVEEAVVVPEVALLSLCWKKIMNEREVNTATSRRMLSRDSDAKIMMVN